MNILISNNSARLAFKLQPTCRTTARVIKSSARSFNVESSRFVTDVQVFRPLEVCCCRTTRVYHALRARFLQTCRPKSGGVSYQFLPRLSTGAVLFGGSLSWGLWGVAADCKIRTKGSSRVLDKNAYKDSGDFKHPRFQKRKFLRLLWPDIWYLVAAVVSALAAALINVQIPVLLGNMVQVVAEAAKHSGNYLQEIRGPAVKLIIAYCLQALCTSSYISLLSAVGERTAVRMREALFAALLRQDIAFFDSHHTGELINRLSADVQDFKSAFKLCIAQGLRGFTQTLGAGAAMYVLSPKLTLLLIMVVPGLVLVGTGIGASLRSLSRKVQEQVAMGTSVADEALGNMRTVRSFAMEDKELELYCHEIDKSRQLNEKLGLGIGLFQGLSNLALNGIIVGVIYHGGYLLASGDLKAGQLMSFLVASQTIQRSLASISILFGQAIRGTSAGARVFEYLDLEPTIPLKGGKHILYHSFYGNVHFSDVTFSYPTRPDQVVLKDFNLSIPAGKVVAVCGPSGGGKSTVASLLERFYDIGRGSISIDGVDIRELDPSRLRGRTIGFINQEPVLFATTVKENIRYGNPEATDQEVLEAAALANAHEFILGFPEGYDTVLGERGVTISGGQKQRIAIARALIKNPSILILDEATSALDAESERVVQEAIDKVSKGRTVLVIAHRLSTIRNADLIAVLDNGRIQELGTHEALLKRGGIYADLIRGQAARK
ncbi:mitochondrial potassium channel ATP-binding subunit-like [Patiria miniata]|uniref:Mitochondrial potassium channel ATP-binding subunit n=1 Tax=Patiria miniata TaxID=46514 RepID=A0A914AQF8_PATMI|nr:mitochondrial potassium channel ATP-binding subunit-like [Patiria miniata]